MSEKRDMWIAPRKGCGYWTVSDWQQLNLDSADCDDWKTAIQIFEDRINFRFLEAIETLKQSDDQYYQTDRQRRYGFAATALMALLIETLAQFYDGVKESPSGDNKNFYVEFLTSKSLILKDYFNQDDRKVAEIFYKTIRCGILHQAETRENSLIRYRKEDDWELSNPFERIEKESLIVYWAALFRLLKQEIEEYKEKLKSGDQILQENFKTKMNIICQVSNS